jgi:hypothetical protein
MIGQALKNLYSSPQLNPRRISRVFISGFFLPVVLALSGSCFRGAPNEIQVPVRPNNRAKSRVESTSKTRNFGVLSAPGRGLRR